MVWGGAPRFRACTFIDNESLCDSGAITFVSATEATFTDCQFIGNRVGGAVASHYTSLTFERCTFESNSTWVDGVVRVGASSQHPVALEVTSCTFYDSRGGSIGVGRHTHAEFDNTIIAFGATGAAITCDPTGDVTLTCCDIYGNVGGDWVGCIADQYDINGNISGDPLFCDAGAGDFTLDAASPCAPENSGGCGLIGAWPVGCGTVAVPEQESPGVAVRLRVAPNPTLHGATFTFDAATHPLALEIFDPAGRLVEKLAPTGAVTWTPSDRAPRGVYFARLSGDGVSETVKFVVLR
jgi:hypothetical protein